MQFLIETKRKNKINITSEDIAFMASSDRGDHESSYRVLHFKSTNTDFDMTTSEAKQLIAALKALI